MKGIIFDFNGTMIQDSHLHEKAWIELIKEHSKRKVSDEEIVEVIHGRTNGKILHHFLGDLSNEEISELSEKKEQHYRNLFALEHIELTDGLEQTLDTLISKEIPITIATASPQVNVDFYFDHYHLGRWFDRDKVVHDDGTFPGKPEPDIFLRAAKKLDLLPEQCTVIEDALSGLQAAHNAGIGKILAIAPSKESYQYLEKSGLCEDGIMKDFQPFFHC